MDVLKETKELYLKNCRTHGQFQYTVPSPSSYPYQWLWDSCFHAVVLSHFDTRSAQKELLSATVYQFESGLLPHITYWQPQEKLRFDWGVENTSAITQPPIIAYATWRVYEKSQDKRFLKKIYPRLQRYFAYLLTRKDSRTGLVGIINPDESGEDDSPRFDSSLGLPPQHTAQENNERRFALFTDNKTCRFDVQTCMKEHFWVQDVAFNAYLVEGLEHLAKIAHECKNAKTAEMYKNEAAEIRTAMRTYMLQDSLFYSLDTYNNPILVKTWSILTPLLADAYTEEEAGTVIETLLRDVHEFATTYPIPSTAVSEPGYQPLESDAEPAELHPNWRGPVWMATNWFAYRGLLKYGYEHEARSLARQSKRLVQKSGFREYYDPYTGKGMGAKDFTWGGLVLDMAE